ncbi:UvrD-helicase domain-containing protein [bacterium]|nr:UvrD-helicase domain-containing protein [bacterium]
MSLPFLQELNEVQKNAVRATDGPVLILAGAGSGKTSVLTRRIAYLIAEKKISPFYILAVTFTNKAAEEMKQRVEKLVGSDSRKIWIGTFHSIFGKILRFEAEKIGYGKNYTIYDSDDQLNLIKSTMEFLSISQEMYSPNLMRAKISRSKNTLQSPSQAKRTADNPIDEKAAMVFEEYEKRLLRSNAFDFDDLIIKPIELFQQYPDVLAFYQDKFRFIHIDEYQDTNRAQYLLINMLAQKYKNICVVGDDDQSIYGWRHADIGNILNFEKDYPGTHVFKLEQNYRSTQNILRVASEVVRNNLMRKEKTLWTQKAAGELITVFECEDDRMEAQVIVDTIKTSIHKEKRKFCDFAILCRTNAQTRVIEDALRQHALPYVIVGGVRFYERKEIKDILAYLKVIANPADTISLDRIINFPPRGIGKTTTDKLEDFAMSQNQPLFSALTKVREFGTGWLQERAITSIQGFCDMIKKYRDLNEHMSLSEWVRILIEEIGLLKMYKQENTIESISRYENVIEFMNAISDFSMKFDRSQTDESMLDAFLKEVTLVTDVDQYDERKNAVTIMTIHASKGLEFPVVFVAGLEEGLFPIESSIEYPHQLEEERRLFYVSTTRAQKDLYLCFAKRRMRFNQIYRTMASRFVNEVPADLVKWEKRTRYAVNEDEAIREFFADSDRSGVRHHTRKNNGRGKSIAGMTDELISKAAAKTQNFQIGQTVVHATFGKGKILEMDGFGEQQKLTIQFEDGTERRLVVKFANLMIR